MEVTVVEMVVASHGILTVDLATRDESRLTAYLAQFVEQVACFFPGDALHVDGSASEIAGLGIVGEGEMSHTDHLTHQFYLSLRHAVIQSSTITEDGNDNRGQR